MRIVYPFIKKIVRETLKELNIDLFSIYFVSIIVDHKVKTVH